MNILSANESHIPGMLALLQQVGQVHHDIRPDLFRDGAQKYDTEALKAILADPDRPIFIAEEMGAVAGYCFCIRKVIAHNPVLTTRKELYIDDLCVDEKLRGQGIAKALYRYVTDYAKAHGYHYVTLNVWCGNDSAMRFYEKAGMTPRSITMETKVC